MLKRPGGWAVCVLQILAEVFSWGPLSALVWAMYADVADYYNRKKGNRPGSLASTMAQKVGWALAGVVTMALLSLFGYKANIARDRETSYRYRDPFCRKHPLCVLIIFYALDDKFMARRIQKELAEKS